MATEFKYIGKEDYLEFAINFNEKIDEVINDPIIRDFFNGKELMGDEKRERKDTLRLAESFLHLMCDHEEYEACQDIVDHYPELRIHC